jgi:hypothetical protein
MKSVKSIAHTPDWSMIVLKVEDEWSRLFNGSVLVRTGENEYEVVINNVLFKTDDFIWADEPLFFGGE